MSRLLDPKDKRGEFPFRYTPAAATDVKETFRKARERIEAEAKRQAEVVKQLPRKSK